MKFSSWFVSVLICGVMAGCAGTLPPKVTSINTLQPGKLQVRKAGEPMLERGVLKVQPGFKAKVDAFLPKAGDILLPPVKRGDVLECTGKATDEYLVCGLPARIQNGLITENGTRIADVHKFAFKPWGEFVGVITPTGRVVEIDDARKVAGIFESIEIPLTGSQKTELIYDGRFDDVIKITYLEFGSDFTKPTYFKGLSYNVSSLNLINIKEMMIEVVEANEKEIRFIVRN